MHSGAALNGAATNVRLLLDDSLSMAQSDGVDSRLDVAKRSAKRLVDALPVGSRVAVWRTSAEAASAIIAKPTGDLVSVKEAIDSVHVTDRRSNIQAALVHVADSIEANASATMLAYTDGQRQSIGDVDALVEELRRRRNKVDATFVITSHSPASNLALTDLHVADGIVLVDRPTRFVATITNAGTVSVNDARVSLRTFGPTAKLDQAADVPIVDQQTIDRLEPGQSRSVTLVARLQEAGSSVVQASLQPDRLPNDDARCLLVTARNRLGVLIVDGDIVDRGPQADSFFLQRALVPSVGLLDARGPIDLKVVSPTSFESTSLDETQFVVLVNVPDLTPGAAQRLRRFVDSGGGLIVFAGEQVQRDFYNTTLALQYDLLPVLLGDVRTAPDGAAFRFDLRAIDHPVSRLWADASAGRLDSVEIRRRVLLALRDGARVMLRYGDGTPAVVDAYRGRGYVCVVSTSADTSWTDLPVKPAIFVPLVYRSIGQALVRHDETTNGMAGTRVSIDLPEETRTGAAVAIAGPHFGTARPGLDAEPVAEQIAGRPGVRWDRTDHAGVYDASVDGKPASRFALTPDSRESDATPMSGDARRRIESVARVVDSDGTLASASSSSASAEWSLPLLTVLLVLTVVEMILAQRFGRPK
ncbi:MAG: VWA domain-containing protein [Tepidisphaeraceae bacterium]